MRFFLTLCALTSLLQILPAQSDEAARKLQLAQTLERSGDWKQATSLYEDLWLSDTTNYVYFDALHRAYSQLKEYDKALRLIEHRLRIRPSEFYLTAFLGGVYFDAGLRAQADSAWEALLRVQPRQRQMYALVAQQMQERRLFGRAIDTYRKGRAAVGNEAEFAQELAMLHSATQAYGDAVAEYLRILEQTPHQLGYVQSRIASFTIRDEGLRQAEASVSSAIARKPDNIQFRSLHAWILMEQGRFAEALPVYRTIDSLSAGNGAQVYTFAQAAVREGFYTEASRAFNDIIMLTPPSPLRSQALYGMAQAYEQARAGNPVSSAAAPEAAGLVPESMPPPDSALMAYARVIGEYPGSQPAIQSMFRIGIIRYERLFDLDGAMQAFDEVRKDRRAGNLAWDALLMSTDVLVAKGDVPGARSRLLEAPTPARTFLGERFTLQYARLSYYLGEFNLAQGMLRGVIETLSGDAANDGLTLYYHIQDGAVDSASLASFAKAEVLELQRKHAEALQYYREVSVNARTAMLASRSRLSVAEMLVMLGKPEQAITLLDSVVTTYQTDVLRDRALFRVGSLYQHQLKDTARARAAYEKFLVLFPTSVFADEVRHRVRILGKDPS